NTTVAGNYSVVVTDSHSCSSSSQGATLSFYNNPSVLVSAPSVCSGSTATVTATPSGGSGTGYSYAWTVPASFSNPGNVASFNTTVAGNYSVVVTDSHSC